MGKKIKKYIIIILAIFALSGCNKNNNSDNSIDASALQNGDYGYGSSWNNNFSEQTCSADCKITNMGDDVSIGMLAFVNGIPQMYTDMNNSLTYLSSISIDKDDQQTANIHFIPVSGTNEGISVVRYTTMLKPEIIRTNDIAVQLGFIHSILSTYPSTYELKYNSYSEEVNIVDCEGAMLKDSCSKSYIEDKLNEEAIGFVNYRPDFHGEYSIEIGSEQTEEYIISFWGDNRPIAIGSNMYYKVAVNGGQVNKYIFDITEKDLNEISNFYVIACPIGNDKNNVVLKTRTKVISDKKLINSYEDAQSETDDSLYEQNTNEYEADSEYVFEQSCGSYIYSFTQPQLSSLVTQISQRSISDETDFKEYALNNPVEDRNIHLYPEGVFINNDKECILLDNSLNEIFKGDISDYYQDYPISSGSEFLYMTDKECIAFSNDVGIVSKNISDGKETLIYNSLKDEMVPTKLYVVGNRLIFDAVSTDGKDTTSMCVYDRNTGSHKNYDSKLIHQLSGNGKVMLVDEYATAFEINKPYAYLYDIEKDTLTRVDFGDKRETQNSSISYDGQHIITYLYREDQHLIDVMDYYNQSSKIIHSEEAIIVTNIVQSIDSVCISFADSVIADIPDYVYKLKE